MEHNPNQAVIISKKNIKPNLISEPFSLFSFGFSFIKKGTVSQTIKRKTIDTQTKILKLYSSTINKEKSKSKSNRNV